MTQQAKKRAVVLAGGGSRGAYQMGVFRALKELQYDFSIVTGTSVGSLNGAVMAMDDLELGEKMWSQITTEQIINLGEEESFFNSEQVKQNIADTKNPN